MWNHFNNIFPRSHGQCQENARSRAILTLGTVDFIAVIYSTLHIFYGFMLLITADGLPYEDINVTSSSFGLLKSNS